MTLQELREEIEGVDLEIIRLIRARMNISLKIAEEKSAAGLPTRDSLRAEMVLSGVASQAERLDMDPLPVREIFEILIQMSEDLQDRLRG
ncbi:MAG TPA: chorismate mutase [Methanospirillum sp.]|nr:chorismate mutase [Methanospirillum sp.]